MNNDIHSTVSELIEKNIQIQSIIHIGSQVISEKLPEHIHTAFNDNWDDIWSAIFLPEPEEKDISNLSFQFQNIYFIDGFLVQALFNDQESRWVYASSLIEGYEKLLEQFTAQNE